MWGHAPLTKVVEAIRAVGPERSILMSDAGQRHNPMPAEALRVFAQSVHESGVSESDVGRMIRDNPLDLLELPPPPAADATPEGNGQVPAAGPLHTAALP
jgi:predicted metal-dependent TIM-barrel fold hydrolase